MSFLLGFVGGLRELPCAGGGGVLPAELFFLAIVNRLIAQPTLYV